MAIEPKTTARRGRAGSARSASGVRAHTAAGSATQHVAPDSTHHSVGASAPVAGSSALSASETAVPPAPAVRNSPAPAPPPSLRSPKAPDSCGRTVHLSFYDASTLAKLLPVQGTQLELQTADGQWSQSVTITENKTTQLYSFLIPDNIPQQTVNKIEDAETLCDIPTNTDADLLVLSSLKPLAISCQSYTMRGIALVVSSAANELGRPMSPEKGPFAGTDMAAIGNEPPPDSTAPPCSIAVPLTRLEESYTVKFFAYDTCFKDYQLNAKALINDVEVTATPVSTQSSGVATRPRAAKATGRTVDGFVELPGLTPNQLYRIEVKGPSEYVCVKPPQPYLYHLLGRSVPIHAHFQPCGKFPARTVIFAQQGCLGLRVSKLNFQAGGQPAGTDENGIWNVPAGTTGTIDFQSPGKVFSPASIEFNDDTAMAIVVGVAEQTVGQFTHPGGSRFYFVDEKGEPFKHRKLLLRSHSGEEVTVYTGSDGGFHADEGWLASAEEDASGCAVSAYPLCIARV
jgi:hypothetical protein